jgi:hypothetical protein
MRDRDQRPQDGIVSAAMRQMPQRGAGQACVSRKLSGRNCSARVRIVPNKTPNASTDAHARHAQTWGLLFSRDAAVVLDNTPAMPLEEALFGGFFASRVFNRAGAADSISPVALRGKVAPPARRKGQAVMGTREGLAR